MQGKIDYTSSVEKMLEALKPPTFPFPVVCDPDAPEGELWLDPPHVGVIEPRHFNLTSVAEDEKVGVTIMSKPPTFIMLPKKRGDAND